MVVVWWVIISLRLLMSCRTSLVVTRPLLSSKPANSGFEYATAVASFPLRGLLLFRGTIGSKSSRVKSRAPLWMFVGEGSGPPVGGSAIGPELVPARHTITFYIAIVSTVPEVLTRFSLSVPSTASVGSSTVHLLSVTVLPEIGVTTYTLQLILEPYCQDPLVYIGILSGILIFPLVFQYSILQK
jgi:hypothetical protein